MRDFIEIDTDRMEPPKVGDSLYENRRALVEMQEDIPEVSIIVQAFNRLEKTRRCVKSILSYTKNIDYELILLDNGSSDGTLEYFHSVPWPKKKIIHITKNIGAGYPALNLYANQFGKYICTLSNDNIVTPHWLENLLICMNSDPKIGMVNPVSSNTSNLQSVEFSYKTYEEMQKKAAQFNRSDPRKWEDRQRLITIGTLYRKEVFLASGWPIGDAGFFHDFGDDDLTFKIRRLGYRTVLAGDTWICHDHDLRSGEGKDPVEFQRSLKIGRENFQEKYFGVDAWEDVNNFYIPYFGYFPPPKVTGRARVLGVDVRCGTPILDIKNWLRKSGIFNTELSAFTQDPKYWLDLKTICAGPVLCDREEFLTDSFLPDYFDYVVADRPLNRYHEPQKMLDGLFSLCRGGGIVACKLKNTFSFQEYVHLLGQRNVYDREFAYDFPVDVFHAALSRLGTVKAVIAIPFSLDEDSRRTVESLIPAELPKAQRSDILGRMLCREYLFLTEKS